MIIVETFNSHYVVYSFKGYLLELLLMSIFEALLFKKIGLLNDFVLF